MSEAHITADQWRRIEEASKASYPNEACGLFVGATWDNAELVPMENVQDRYHDRDPVRYPRTARTAYLMHPLRLMEHVERAGGLLAIWHSHCDVGAYFSSEDVNVALGGGEEPLWPGTAYIVVSCRAGGVDGAKWFDWNAGERTFHGRDIALPAAKQGV
jgi:proteasome lid subunit RPN8/RPN11